MLNSVGVVFAEDNIIVSEGAGGAAVIVEEALTPSAFHQIELNPAAGPRRIVDSSHLFSKFLFEPWMREVKIGKINKTIHFYAIAPHNPSHLSKQWSLYFYSELYDELCEKFPFDVAQIRDNLLYDDDDSFNVCYPSILPLSLSLTSHFDFITFPLSY